MKSEERMGKLLIDHIDGHMLSEKIKEQKVYVACDPFFSKRENKNIYSYWFDLYKEPPRKAYAQE